MNPNAILRQTARGPMIHLEAVHEGLRGDRICAAGLDVRRPEPLDRSHPLHAAWAHQESWLKSRFLVTPNAEPLARYAVGQSA